MIALLRCLNLRLYVLISAVWVMAAPGLQANHIDLEALPGPLPKPPETYFEGLAARDGLGGPVDIARAERLFRQAAEGGYPAAMTALGTLLVTHSEAYREAARWFDRAQSLGDPIAATNLAFAYWKGIGVRADPELADALFARAIAAGYAPAADYYADFKSQPVATGSEPEPGQWWYRDGENRVGPFASGEMRKLLDEGALASETLVWREGLEPGWQPLSETELGRGAERD